MKYKNKIVFGLLSLIFLSSIITSLKTETYVKLTSHQGENILEIPSNAQSNQGFNTSISKNQILVVKLSGNPTTGYSWYLSNRQNLDLGQLKPININQYGSSDDYQVDAHEPGMVGVGGKFYFKFQPIKSGVKVELIFIYQRSWMPGENTKTVRVTVDITD